MDRKCSILSGASHPLPFKTVADLEEAEGDRQATKSSDYMAMAKFSISKLPRDLSGLSIHQVGECLCQLNLGNYVDIFQSQQIDGQMLSELDEDILTKDFTMTRFQAVKLLMFVKQGWRPNYSETLGKT